MGIGNMGKRGPKPTPTAILSMRGSWRASARSGEPEATEGVPECPRWLREIDTFAAEVWEELIPLLVAQKTIAEIDATAVTMFCQSYSLWKRSTELAECCEPGSLERERLRREANNALVHVHKFARCFGLTPADRAGLKVEKNEQTQDTKARFFFGSN